jgi:hypothetical protein
MMLRLIGFLVTVLLLIGVALCAASSVALTTGRATQQVALSLDGQHVLALEYGALCLPSLPRSACVSGVRRAAVQLSYRTPEQRRVLTFVALRR